MKVTVLYVGSSLLAPLKNAERELNQDYKLDLLIAAHNFGTALDQDQWSTVDRDLAESDVVFVIHVMDGENATRLLKSLGRYLERHHAIVVINCMPDLMRLTRMGKLDVARMFARDRTENGETDRTGKWTAGDLRKGKASRAVSLMTTAGSWIGRQALGRHKAEKKSRDHGAYLKLVDRVPSLLRFVPNAGTLRDVKNYLYLFCYFLQPSPANIKTMILFALKHYVPDPRLQSSSIKLPLPATMPSVAIYHPDAPGLFETFSAYRKWYLSRAKSDLQSAKCEVRSPDLTFDPETTVGLLLMRPQIVSNTRKHYDTLIRAIEAEGLSVIPAISTLMDNRQACETFFVESSNKSQVSSVRSQSSGLNDERPKTKDERPKTVTSRVSQIVSLTGFSFVGGPAMNDSSAASDFLKRLNRPYRSAVSLDTQTIEAWQTSLTGLNPVQAGMQIAIPEIDGATEPFVYGGIHAAGVEPVALPDRCERFARRLSRWNRLQTAPRSELKLALVLFCFPPNKGNIGTAADLDVFPSLWETINALKRDGYEVKLPASAVELRELLLGGNSEMFGAPANVCYRMPVDEYRRLSPFVDEVEKDWGRAPGFVNSFGNELLIQGVTLGNIFIGIQPTFGYEGDPMRLMMARSGAPHHGFVSFYTYLSRVLNVDAVIHVGTHGSLEFMPGKQVGLSGECWPDRLIGELPNIYLYSVNNPSEGSIAKRRSYAELISYLTPPLENAGLYKELATLKDLVMAYGEADEESERVRLFRTIEEYRQGRHFDTSAKEAAQREAIT